MTNEEAIQIIRDEIDFLEEEYENEAQDFIKALRLALSALSRDRWISVEERLPEIRHSVLIFTKKGGTAEGEYVGDGWTQYRWSAMMGKDVVTHWMPLPEPPKEET